MFLLGALAPSMFGTLATLPINESGVGPFGNIQVFTLLAGSFTVPAMSGFSNNTWTDVNENANWAVASGNSVTNLTFTLSTNYTAIPMVEEIFFFNLTGQMVDGVKLTDTGTKFVISAATYADYQNDLATLGVPEPGSLGLVTFAGILCFFETWRRRRLRLQRIE